MKLVCKATVVWLDVKKYNYYSQLVTYESYYTKQFSSYTDHYTYMWVFFPNCCHKIESLRLS